MDLTCRRQSLPTKTPYTDALKVIRGDTGSLSVRVCDSSSTETENYQGEHRNHSNAGRTGGLDPSLAAGEHLECHSFLQAASKPLSCVGRPINQPPVRKSPANGSALTKVCVAKRNLCSASEKNNLQGPSRQMCDITPQLRHHLMHVVLGQWWVRHKKKLQVENTLMIWGRVIFVSF